jgi:AraC-like DNA-binding protein
MQFAAHCPKVEDDVMSEILRDLRLAHAAYGRSEFTAPWGLELPFEEGVRFHFMVEGECWLHAGDRPPLRLMQGDIVLLPHGTGHVIADRLGAPPQQLREIDRALVGNNIYRLRAGGDGPRALIICCTIGFDGPTAHPLLQMLPELLHISATEHPDRNLADLLRIMAEEVGDQRIGSATIMARLADVVVTRLIRTWIETRPAEMGGWLAAVRDAHIGRAIAAIHRRPGARWTVDALAAEARLSRSTFADRFTALLGVSPARYLLQWRMRLAAAWLRGDVMSIAEAAEQLGYASEPAFSRAFKRFFGATPGAVRARRALPVPTA